MNESIARVKAYVREKASNPMFRHHTWFVKWHLEIVESIAEDLLLQYPDADKDLVRVMVWMHDYGKIVDFDSQYAHEHVDSGRAMLVELGCKEAFADSVAEGIKTLDAKVNLDTAPIEVQIVSSADGCSHLVGPFVSLYWWENPQKPYEEIMAENLHKLTADWEKKVVLPEARHAFQQRHDMWIEQSAEPSAGFSGIGAQSVDSVNFYVTNVSQSVAFYSNKLGLELDYRQGDDYASFVVGNINLGLKRSTEDRERPGSQTIILATGDARKKYAEMAHDGLTVHHPLSDDPWGMWFSVSDPDGNLIEYLQRK